ncbi:MAG: hypothetical protein AAB938_00325 [Patescibacteria group bacterium]
MRQGAAAAMDALFAHAPCRTDIFSWYVFVFTKFRGKNSAGFSKNIFVLFSPKTATHYFLEVIHTFRVFCIVRENDTRDNNNRGVHSLDSIRFSAQNYFAQLRNRSTLEASFAGARFHERTTGSTMAKKKKAAKKKKKR